MVPKSRVYYLLIIAAAGIILGLAGQLSSSWIVWPMSAAIANLLAFRVSRRWIGIPRTLTVFVCFWAIGFAFWHLIDGAISGALILPPTFLASYAAGSQAGPNRLAKFITCIAILFASIFIASGSDISAAFTLSVVSGVLGWFLIDYFEPMIETPGQLADGAVMALSTILVGTNSIWVAVAAAVLVLLFAVLSVYRFVRFDDLIVFVDENKTPTGTSQKLEAHHSATRLHLAFSVFIFNSAGELLLQKRADAKKTWPGVWSNSCCGHQMLHETPAATAKSRIKYELGLSGVKLHLVVPDFRYRAEKDGVVENEICPVFVGFTDKEVKPNPEEVGMVRWVDWLTFVTDVELSELGISPWAVEEVRLLASNEKFRRLIAENTGPRLPASTQLPEPDAMC